MRSNRMVLLGAFAITCLAVSPTTSSSAASVSPLAPTTAGVMHRWSAAHMASDWKKQTITETRAVMMARAFDLIVVAPGEFDAFEAAMHAANPH